MAAAEKRVWCCLLHFAPCSFLVYLPPAASSWYRGLCGGTPLPAIWCCVHYLSCSVVTSLHIQILLPDRLRTGIGITHVDIVAARVVLVKEGGVTLLLESLQFLVRFFCFKIFRFVGSGLTPDLTILYSSMLFVYRKFLN